MNDLSFVLARRLRKLRESRGLSLPALSKALNEKYGIQISKESLSNYEIDHENHTKARKNEGMSVKYLRCLADFYGVSTDYLLGVTDTQSPDVNAQAAREYTHLSEKSIERLRFMEKNNKDDFHIVDYLIASNDLWMLADDLKETTKFVAKEGGVSGSLRGFFGRFFRWNFLQSCEACYDRLLKEMCPVFENKLCEEDEDSFALSVAMLKWTMEHIPYPYSDEETEGQANAINQEEGN